MNSFLVRLWQCQARLSTSTSTRWSSGRRRRDQWTCSECLVGALRAQQRSYSDDIAFSPFGHILTPSQEARREGSNARAKGPKQQSPDATWSVDKSGGKDSHDSLQVDGSTGVVKDGEETQSSVAQLRQQPYSAAKRFAKQRTRERRRGPEDLQDNIQLDKLIDIDYKSLFPVGLDSMNADLVLRCLLAATRANDEGFIREMTSDTFMDVLNIAQPSSFMGQLGTTHEELSGDAVRLFGIAPSSQVSGEVADMLQRIVDIRVQATAGFAFLEYKKLLLYARDLGHAKFAKTLWHSLCSDGFTPDLDCYNYYMGAIVWDGLNDADVRLKYRVIPFNMAARQTARLGPNHWNFRVREQGLQFTVMQILSEILEKGLTANVESFRLLVTAAAREGDMATVKSILRNIWAIDVDALMAETAQESTPTTTQMARDSPLYPTSELLFTIAHAFGINNNLPAALRVVDQVARRFEILIDRKAWAELFEWTFVLGLRRSGVSARTDGTKEGALPKQSVLSLWNTMTNPPYNVQPSMHMYNHLIKNLCQREWPPEMLKHMEEGKLIYFQSRVAAGEAFKRLDRVVAGKFVPGLPKFPHLSLQRLRREYEDASLVRKKNLTSLQRWVRLLLSATTGYIRTPGSDKWAFQDLPRMLWHWAPMAPSHVVYEAPGGIVEFYIHSFQAQRQSARAGSRERERRVAIANAAPRLIGREWALPDEAARRPRRVKERVWIQNKIRVRNGGSWSQARKV